MKVLFVVFLAIGVCLAIVPTSDAQCAMCKATLEGSAEGRAMASAFNSAILVMLAAPYLIFGSFTGFLFRKRISAWLSPQLARARSRRP